ncbi:hypothetical protein [Psychrobium sp. 1_MG-2023]|uniref:hypothetical protein n=1 Tax=Psychrobium sp. 1_MG-2023 TaxID=3062624 RepID=UPI000C33A11A|nr:hypothetical protein [Psychrobium sp. 1_MG-2023]MDP2560643.1 hypothetical protein [Psychrobium sp. 1_MG-2023]PKF56540.1 hypothetical protein CW748_08625 [Alteromonadales bacterium alter-6D02]
MWPKTLIAIFVGCIVSISLMLNINYLMPFAIDTRLFIGLLCAFPIWVGVMTWCYASESAKQALKRCAILLVPSVAMNALFLV